jgi:alkanesulfonate monooxygenase SsuD/methylene tetrahydromethanopterin reductase-like flavin-dependent oxidoreductase (luciferase family)/putative sterol carrier protein
MRFGLFYEHQLPRPWTEGSEEQLLNDALEQIELADRAGFDTVWEVEHHFLEEYSHSSAPEVFLAAASQRTKRIRLGHGIVQLPPGFNHPARVAERIATLDLVSGGRVEFGTGEASSQMELGGFGVDREAKRAQWEEALDVITRMLVETPFTGHQGRYLSVPPRNVIPKPKQRPHPPLWAACSRRDTILLAASKGIGALSFSFVEPEEARQWVDDYYAIIASEKCVPAGFDINPNVAVVLPFMLHRDEGTAIDRGIDGGHFFGYSLAHYYVFGEHRPGRTNLYAEFERNRDQRGFARDIVTPDQAPLNVRLLQQGLGSLRGAIGTPEQVHSLVERYQAAGVDQVIFVAQAGRNRHEHICESIELFAQTVLPRFAADADAQDAARTERLATAREQALRRRRPARSTSLEHVVTPQGEPGMWAAPATTATSRSGRSRREAIAEAIFRRAVRGRSDAYLERVFGSGPAQRMLFRGMERSFAPERARGFSGDLQYELSGRNGPRLWTLRVTGHGATAHPGPATTAPAVIMRMPLTTFVRVAAGQDDPGHALMDGRLQIEGDIAVASRIGEMFGGPSPW